jgi:hypothetical protein
MSAQQIQLQDYKESLSECKQSYLQTQHDLAQAEQD